MSGTEANTKSMYTEAYVNEMVNLDENIKSIEAAVNLCFGDCY